MTSVHFSSASVEWATPRGVYEELDREFRFDLDPCPLGGDADGLSTLFLPWRGRRVFCNPPYDAIRKWLERAHEADLAVFPYSEQDGHAMVSRDSASEGDGDPLHQGTPEIRRCDELRTVPEHGGGIFCQTCGLMLEDGTVILIHAMGGHVLAVGETHQEHV